MPDNPCNTNTHAETPVETQRAGVTRKRSSLKISLYITVCAFVVVAAGFASFYQNSRNLSHPSNIKADGIVVLTGGSERIAAAVNLLTEKAAKRLLITGVNPTTTAKRLRTLLKADAALFDCCVDLDTKALDTRGNAVETASWAAQKNFTRLVVVTSDYHILRSMLEFSRVMPDHELIVYPVSSRESSNPLGSVNAFKLWFGEYVKYLLALLRITHA